MKTKGFMVHFNGASISTDVIKGTTTMCENFVLHTPKLELSLTEVDEMSYSDVEVPLEQLEALSKLLVQLMDNIKSDEYLNGKKR